MNEWRANPRLNLQHSGPGGVGLALGVGSRKDNSYHITVTMNTTASVQTKCWEPYAEASETIRGFELRDGSTALWGWGRERGVQERHQLFSRDYQNIRELSIEILQKHSKWFFWESYSQFSKHCLSLALLHSFLFSCQFVSLLVSSRWPDRIVC